MQKNKKEIKTLRLHSINIISLSIQTIILSIRKIVLEAHKPNET